jgi:DNA-binding transcriptional regulator WhiA
VNEKEAELIGMHTGDGTLYKTNSGSLVWEMRGSIYEKEYYEYVTNLIKQVLNVKVKPKYRGPNSYGIQTTKKKITSFFIKNGFKSGSKVYTVSIPNYIKHGNLKIKRAFIRGLFDTDGCIRFDKNRTSYHYYPKIEFNLASRPLRDGLFVLFRRLGFRAYIWQYTRKDGEEFKICLAGFANLEKWINEVSTSNPKHKDRIKQGLLNKPKVHLKKDSTNL